MKSDKFYNLIAPIYPLIDIFLSPHKRRLIDLINSNSHKRILEIGIANGSHLKQYTSNEIYGIDSSRRMIELAIKSNPNLSNLLVMNGEELSFNSNEFDAVILSHICSVTDNLDLLIQESARVLKPDGNLYILNHFTPTNPLRYIDKLFSVLSMFFFFKSEFFTSDINTPNNLSKVDKINLALFSYFKILIYKKL